MLQKVNEQPRPSEMKVASITVTNMEMQQRITQLESEIAKINEAVTSAVKILMATRSWATDLSEPQNVEDVIRTESHQDAPDSTESHQAASAPDPSQPGDNTTVVECLIESAEYKLKIGDVLHVEIDEVEDAVFQRSDGVVCILGPREYRKISTDQSWRIEPLEQLVLADKIIDLLAAADVFDIGTLYDLYRKPAKLMAIPGIAAGRRDAIGTALANYCPKWID